jgi:hypothetical protein
MQSAICEPDVIMRDSKPISVIVPIQHYRKLLEQPEDGEDLLYLDRLNKKSVQFRPSDSHLARTKHI